MQDYPLSYYAATAAPPPETSTLDGDRTTDVCVVGAGFTGLSTALHLAGRGYDVTVLEAQRIGWGASGRNGGQVGSGQRRETLALEKLYGPATTRILWNLAEEAKQILQTHIEQRTIQCDYRPGNLMGITRLRFVDEVRAELDNLAQNYGYEAIEFLDADRMGAEVASADYVAGALDWGGGHLNPLKLAFGLARAAANAGARLHEGTPVQTIDWRPGRTAVRTRSGTIEARYVALCTNGYLGQLEPRLTGHIMPLINHIVASEPLGEERARTLIPSGACVFSTKHVVDYYRLSPDGRLLFGGGETYSNRPPDDIIAFVRPYMLKVFPQLADVALEYGWSGTLGITRNRMPHFGRLAPNGFFAQGFSGHGVAMTQIAGKLMAEAIAGTAERFDVMAGLKLPRFPGGSLLRHPLLVIGMLYYSLLDRI